MTNSNKVPNRLIEEKSPYLLQHAYNPVDWYPWGDEAFAKAKSEDKPIFLSIGYSTCHWCHVMEKETYSRPEIISRISQNFMPARVDQDSRPDLSKLYRDYRTWGMAPNHNNDPRAKALLCRHLFP